MREPKDPAAKRRQMARIYSGATYVHNGPAGAHGTLIIWFYPGLMQGFLHGCRNFVRLRCCALIAPIPVCGSTPNTVRTY